MTTDDSDTRGGTERLTDGRWTQSRRRFLGAAAGAGAVAGVGRLGGAQQAPVEIRLGGAVDGWTVPEAFEADVVGEGPNPPLMLEAGRSYRVVWTNLDGLPHNFAVADAEGNYRLQSEIIGGEGATQTVEFTAEEGMAEYVCVVHPGTMRGEIRFGGSETATPTPDEPAAGFFEPGARVGVRTVAEGMTAPTDFAVAEGDDRRFVTDQTGEVWVVTDEGRRETPFVDVSDRIVELGQFFGDYADPEQSYDERGLLGIEFHPSFADDGRFYLHYSAPPDGVDRDLPADNWDHWEVLSEFRATEDGSEGRPETERRLMEIPSPQYNHDAGPLAFGPDGFLYFPMGDGGGANDDMYGHVSDWYEPNGGGNGQDITDNLLGSVLRIDVDGGDEGDPYGIPADNPFAGTDARPEIYAYGFRNPFGISFDDRGNMFVADAGQNLFEEADVVEAGGNYGWNVTEGTHCFSTEAPGDPAAITDCPDAAPDEPPHDGARLRDPIVEFPHTYDGESVGITIVGGHRYERSAIPDLQGAYVYGAWTTDPARDEPAGRLLTAEPPAGFDDGGTPTATDTATPTQDGGDEGDGDQVVPRDRLWTMRELVIAGTDGRLDYFVRMFGRGTDGELYVLVNRRGVPEGDTGAVLQLVPPAEGETTTGTATDTPDETPTGAGTENATGDGSGAGG